MKKIKLIIISALCLILSCVVFTSCAENKYTSFNFINVGADGVKEEQWLGIKFDESKTVAGVYINVGELGSSSVQIKGYRCTSDSYSATSTLSVDVDLTKEKIKYAQKNNDGWIKLNENDFDYTSTSSRYKLILVGGITLNEIVILDINGKKIPYSVEKANFAYYQGDRLYMSEMTSSTFNEKDFENGKIANLNDEQDKFVKP